MIYAVTQALIEQPDVLVTKLASGKLASAREGWQMGNLTRPAGSLLALVAQHGEMVTNDLVPRPIEPGGSNSSTR